MKVTIVNYGIGNILSVERAFMHIGAEVSFADSPEDIAKAERLVVPGVGAFKNCMEAIEKFSVKDSLIDFAASGRPYLGICVGMQMLMDKSSEFGEQKGLGLISGDVKKMEVSEERVPFIGWKEVNINDKDSKFYFVHSYQAVPAKEDNLLATYSFGEQKIAAAVQRDNVIGVQFHPEKSAEDGLNFIKSFMKI